MLEVRSGVARNDKGLRKGPLSEIRTEQALPFERSKAFPFSDPREGE